MGQINKVRNQGYWFVRMLGDVNAVMRGKVGRRMARKAAGRFTGKGLGDIFKGWK